MSLLCLIPARGGSKRLPNKNIKLLCGKPLIAYPITTALESGVVDKVVVTSDSPEIRKIAKEWGAEVDDEKPELATDTVTAWVAMVDYLERTQPDYDNMMLLIGAKPLVTSQHVREAYKLFIEQDANIVMSMQQLPWLSDMNYLSSDGVNATVRNWETYARIGRWSYPRDGSGPREYCPDGAIAIWKLSNLRKEYYAQKEVVAYVSPGLGYGDIDTLEDLELAEMRLKLQLEKGRGKE